ncbi:hypothetical protein ACWEVP_03235 [Amycolatopsis sp. NPDC003865]
MPHAHKIERATLLMRIPHGKDVMGITQSVRPTFLKAGYPLVVQDCRGNQRPEDEFVPHTADCTEGEGTLASIAVRLDGSSSNFPRYDRNTTTGGLIARKSKADLVPAIDHVHHGPEHPSRLVLPIIDRRDQP